MRLRLYRLIWQRALASPDGGEGARDDDGRAGRRSLRAARLARRRPCSMASRGLHRGPRRRRRRRRGGAAAAALAEGDVDDVDDVTPTQHFTEPPPRYTEATLIKALEEHGIGRPSTYAATISTITDRGYVRVEERRLHPEPVAEIVTDLLVEHFGDYVDVEFTARMEEELDEIARGERAWVPLLRAFYAPLRTWSTRSARSLRRRLHDRGDRRGVLARATRWSSGSGATAGSWPARCTPSTRRRGRCPGDEPPPAGGRPARSAPSAARARSSASAAGSGRSSAARATPTASTSRRTARRRPIRCRSRSPARRTRTATSSRVARDGPATSSGGAPTTRRCDFTTNNEPLGGLHDIDDGRWPARTRRRSASSADRPAMPPPADIVPGEQYPGGPPNPEALARPARARGGRGRRRRQDRWPRRARGARSGGRTTTRRTPPGRAGRRRVSAVSAATATDPALARFLRSLAARDASPHTQRAYRTAVGAYLAWLAERGTDWRAPDANRPARLPRRPRRRAAPRSTVAQRLAAIRSFHRWATRDGLARRRPVGRDRDAAPAAPPATRPRGRPGRAAARGRRRRARRRRAGADPERAALHVALALRDRALVETAYAAGLRISELASADLASLDLRRGRDPGARQGPQAADRAARPTGARRADGLSRGRPAGAPRAPRRRRRRRRSDRSRSS